MKTIFEVPEEYFTSKKTADKPSEEIEEVTIRFAGDSGDGMQLTGGQFSDTTAILGNDLSTLPDYPAEIRAPAGTIAGVSGFQIHFSSKDIHTPGDTPDVLVAMNPAALKANINEVPFHGILVLNTDAFTDDNLKKAGYDTNPLTDDSLSNYRVLSVPISDLNKRALEGHSLGDKDKDRCKNMFALGLMYWMFDRPIEQTEKWLEQKFAKKPDIIKANVATLKAGFHFGETTELLPVHFNIHKAKILPGTYRNITGNEALSLGLIAASELSNTELFLGSYPITPASDILHDISKHANFNVKTFQAEDEIAAVCAAIGASYGGHLAVTSTSGPGVALKSEAINLAVMTELPLIVIDVQRGGPSTGLPTKTEQTDLLMVLYGRNGESPIPVIAPRSPVDCFYKAIEAARIATKYMTPVMLLSEGFLANGTEPWRLPEESDLEKFSIEHPSDAESYQPYMRDKETLARPWAKPGTKGLEHRIGGLEKQDITGNVSYDPDNHELMVKTRAEKIMRISNDIPELVVEGTNSTNSEKLLISWGGTYGAVVAAREHFEEQGESYAHVHIDYINPFPKNFEEIIKKYKEIFVIELNMGQLAFLIQGKFALPVKSVNKVKGKPFMVSEIVEKIKGLS